jgi:predicted GH43/DUF377 family glycosyl hydrolase
MSSGAALLAGESACPTRNRRFGQVGQVFPPANRSEARATRFKTGWLTAALLLVCSACRHYADFTLPALAGGDPGMTFALEPRPEPVLSPGPGWDSHDALNPSVTAFDRGLARDRLNLYSGFDGSTWRTGLATSGDGVHWEKQPEVLSPDPLTWEGSYMAANGSALAFGNRLWYWYQAGPKAGPRIGLARSWDARSWRKEPKPVLDYGPYASWDERAVADPYVIRIEPYFYMYYLGQDRARRQRLGIARSGDGIQWEKLRSSPVLELGGPGAFDENGLGEPAVWQSHGFYWMLYTGRDIRENRRLGLARSSDGVRWRKLPTVFAGAEPWDSKVICDPSVEVTGDLVTVWFGGGDVASPDENLHGRIGMGILRPTRLKEPQ